ncbi:rRNA methyltransferase [Francisella tularensis subsp. holarctica]|nr:rRNA methyltransferase [Francisella tularensis]QHV81136.1 rRNA methyltransferase [Francisella tularensis subsp. holarctica]
MMAFLLDIITFLQISFSTNIFFYKYLFLQISFGLTIWLHEICLIYH